MMATYRGFRHILQSNVVLRHMIIIKYKVKKLVTLYRILLNIATNSYNAIALSIVLMNIVIKCIVKTVASKEQ